MPESRDRSGCHVVSASRPWRAPKWYLLPFRKSAKRLCPSPDHFSLNSGVKSTPHDPFLVLSLSRDYLRPIKAGKHADPRGSKRMPKSIRYFAAAQRDAGNTWSTNMTGSAEPYMTIGDSIKKAPRNYYCSFQPSGHCRDCCGYRGWKRNLLTWSYLSP